MKVPTYDSLQVAPAPLRAPQLDSVASPELLGAKGQQTQQLGNALMRSGEAATDIVVKMQERENADSVIRTESAFKESYIAAERDWTTNRQGRNAKDLTKDVSKWLDDEGKKYSDSLGNKQQQRVFAQRTAALRQSALSSMSQYEALQLERSHDEAVEGGVNASISLAAQTPTPQNIDSARADIVGTYTRQAGRKGWEASVLQDKVLQKTTVLHENVIRGLAAKDPVGAASYFEKYKEEIDGKRHDEIGKFAKDVSASAIADRAAGAIWEKHGPKGDNDPVSLDRMDKAAREALQGNELALRSALVSLRERASAHNSSQAERQTANFNTVLEAYRSGLPLGAIQRLPAFAQLPAVKKLDIERLVGAQHNAMDRVLGALEGRTYLDHRTEADRDAVDLYFERVVTPSAAGMPERQAMQHVVDFSVRTGIVPRRVQGQIRGALRAGSDNARAQAADLLDQLKSANPAFVSAFSAEDIALGNAISTYVRAGIQPATAVTLATEAQKIPAVEREAREARYRTDKAPESNVKRLKNEAMGFRWFSPSMPDALPDALVGEYEMLTRAEFMRFGDLKVAQKTALDQVRGVWGVSRASSDGKGRWMKYAPETIYQVPGEDGSWIREQFVAEAKQGGLFATTAPEFLLQADSMTAREARPSYAVLLRREGVLEPMWGPDGRPLRYRPDYTSSPAGQRRREAIERNKAEAASIVERERARRTQGSGQLSDLVVP